MKTRMHIDQGICGHHTAALVTNTGGRNVRIALDSDCEKIQELGVLLKEFLISADQEINPSTESVVMETARPLLKGTCAGCAVPVGLFTATQVSAGLVLPRRTSISFVRE